MADWKSSQEFLKEFYASPIVNEDTISAKIKRIFLPKSRKASALKELAGDLSGEGRAGAQIRYDYFNLCDKSVFRDHQPLIAPAPECTDAQHFYYREKKLSFTKVEDVYKRALQTAKKGKTFTFHWRGGYLTREVFGELLEQISAAGRERGKSARVSVNWQQAVLRFDYVEAGSAPEASVVMEEANEGEKE